MLGMVQVAEVAAQVVAAKTVLTPFAVLIKTIEQDDPAVRLVPVMVITPLVTLSVEIAGLEALSRYEKTQVPSHLLCTTRRVVTTTS